MENTGLKEALRNALEVFKFYNARKRNNDIFKFYNARKKENKKVNDIIKEENVKIKIVVPILQELGWMSGNKEDVEFEYPCPTLEEWIVVCLKKIMMEMI